MKVQNIHQRALPASPQQVGALIDALSSPDDLLWPCQSWPRMAFDRPLSVGASGGHGPIRYVVDAYTPGHSITFRFTGPAGFNGYHGFEIIGTNAPHCVLRHTLAMSTHGLATITWPLAFRPLHDALIEDSLANAERALGIVPTVQRWSLWVRALRWVIARGRARPQVLPVAAP